MYNNDLYSKNKDLLTVYDIAEITGLHVQTVRKYIRGEVDNGLTLEAQKLGTAAYTTRENFEKWKEEYTAWKAAREGKSKKNS